MEDRRNEGCDQRNVEEEEEEVGSGEKGEEERQQNFSYLSYFSKMLHTPQQLSSSSEACLFHFLLLFARTPEASAVPPLTSHSQRLKVSG